MLPLAESTSSALDPARIPRHIAIIMDGNGRWAKQRGSIRIFGHKSALKSVREAVEGCVEVGVRYLTLYTFSTENWRRPRAEVNALMQLLVSSLRKEIQTLSDNGVQLQVIGDMEALPARCKKELQEAQDTTAQNTQLVLTLALSYGSRLDITRAMQEIARQVAAGTLQPEQIDEQVIARHLSTADMPDPELLIRTSGEYRISNFLLWEIAYSELYICDTLWPDFRRQHLFEAIRQYQGRERRFGKISEQLQS
ncbi:MAG: isoprenyl transferase [Bacteroidetes bacterium]|nr:isoprenyl transferase [Bacteroidota bacterium]